MTTSYFLTGSFDGQDNDFEIIITIPDKSAKGSSALYGMIFTDLADSKASPWQTSQGDFQQCLQALGGFLSENRITLYSKILSSPERSAEVDKELEGFILGGLE
jgi:hypothetical protein